MGQEQGGDPSDTVPGYKLRDTYGCSCSVYLWKSITRLQEHTSAPDLGLSYVADILEVCMCYLKKHFDYISEFKVKFSLLEYVLLFLLAFFSDTSGITT